MVGSSKILTVSYGTFSCTLEGFDDSFGTMKAIAEYFRDLAADDRYFGAEPPVPDAEMLSRIAEREVARRVEARLDGKGVTLRTGMALPQTPAATGIAAVLHSVATAAPAVAPDMPAPGAETPVMPPRAKPVIRQVFIQSGPEPVADSAPVSTAFDGAANMSPPGVAAVATSQPEPAATETAAKVATPVHPDADSVAAKLQRIRAVVGRNSAPLAAQDFAEDLGDGPALTNDGTQAPISPDQSQSLAATWNDLADAEPSDVATIAAPAPHHTDVAGDDADFDIAALTTALAGDLPESDALVDQPETLPETTTETVETAEIVEAVETAEVVETVEAAEVVETVETAEVGEATESAVPPVTSRVIRVRRADFDATAEPVAAISEISEPDSTDLALAALEDMADLDGLTDPMDLDGLDELTAQNEMMALDAEAMLTDAEGIDFDSQPADIDPDLDAYLDLDINLGDSTLPPDAEAELLEELAVLERDATLADGSDPSVAAKEPAADTSILTLTNVMAAAAQAAAPEAPITEEFAVPVNARPGDNFVFDYAALSGADPVPAAAESEHALPALRHGRGLLEREPEADAEAMERILSHTDAELNSPESSRRRQAIAQLKAAVAATEAARILGETAEEPEPDEVENAFRDDLKQVVRPHRMIGEISTEQRSERPRPAPLKLVASQRIDIPLPRPGPKSTTPIRPRRVSVQDEAITPAPVATAVTATSFAEFAASMGATQLPDLLEAAAAYTSFVEGVEDFSRPQLMKKVQDMAEQDFSREDGLRSFGALLRQGRIMKTANGRFVVNEETRFNPERKSA